MTGPHRVPWGGVVIASEAAEVVAVRTANVTTVGAAKVIARPVTGA